MKRLINLIFAIFLLNSGFLYGQKAKKVATGVIGFDTPEYLVTYEVIPFVKKNDCNYPKNNTIIFEVPTTQQYYESIKINQEVTSWFRVFGDDGGNVSGNIIDKNKERWKLIIVGKRIMSKEEIE
jgi:hypothetical protein